MGFGETTNIQAIVDCPVCQYQIDATFTFDMEAIWCPKCDAYLKVDFEVKLSVMEA